MHFSWNLNYFHLTGACGTTLNRPFSRPLIHRYQHQHTNGTLNGPFDTNSFAWSCQWNHCECLIVNVDRCVRPFKWSLPDALGLLRSFDANGARLPCLDPSERSSTSSSSSPFFNCNFSKLPPCHCHRQHQWQAHGLLQPPDRPGRAINAKDVAPPYKNEKAEARAILSIGPCWTRRSPKREGGGCSVGTKSCKNKTKIIQIIHWDCQKPEETHNNWLVGGEWRIATGKWLVLKSWVRRGLFVRLRVVGQRP